MTIEDLHKNSLLKVSCTKVLDDDVFILKNFYMLKHLDLKLLVKFLSIVEQKFEQKKSLISNKNLTFEIKLNDEDNNKLINKTEKNVHLLEINIVERIDNRTILDKTTNVYRKSLEIQKKNKNKIDVMLGAILHKGIDEIKIVDSHVFIKNILKESIKEFLKKEEVDQMERFEESISYNRFFQSLLTQRNILQDAFAELIVDEDLLNYKIAYQTVIFRSLKYSKDSIIPLLKEEGIIKLRNNIVKINNYQDHRTSYLFNGFVNQLVLYEGYNFNLDDRYVQEILNIVDSDNYAEYATKYLENETPFSRDGKKLWGEAIKKKKEGFFIGDIEEKNLNHETNGIEVVVKTTSHYKTMALKTSAYKDFYDEIVVLILNKSDLVEKYKVLFFSNRVNSLHKEINCENDDYKDNIIMIVPLSKMKDMQEIHANLQDVLNISAKIINNLVIERFVDIGYKEKNNMPSSYKEKLYQTLNQILIMMERYKAKEIANEIREWNLKKKLTCEGKKI